jgi:misacylated tRNA(Ala) deacylase
MQQDMAQGTVRLYWPDAYCFATDATVLAVTGNALAVDQSCFYPGGGGQPPDQGWVQLPDATRVPVTSVTADERGVLWHTLATPSATTLVGATVKLQVDEQRRLALMRHHTALHVLNTITLRNYDGWITGVQIGVDQSRIDFKLEGFSPALCADLTARVNAVLAEAHPIKAYFIPAAEFHRRDDLLRTLEAKPPIINGQVRVVEIVGFDVQACGGTHVHSTNAVGAFAIVRTENKGKINKRLYIHLAPT